MRILEIRRLLATAGLAVIGTLAWVFSPVAFAAGPLADYGDAPDPTFPTLFSTTSTPFPGRRGPFHLDVTKEWIGNTDPTVTTTTLETDALIINLDFDDGFILIQRVSLPGIGPTLLGQATVPVTIAASAPFGIRFLNVVADINLDGTWKAYSFAGVTQVEWVVQNLPVIAEPGSSEIVSVAFPFPDNSADAAPRWARATLTTEPVDPSIFGVAGWDGSGPGEGFPRGETEDHLISVTTLPFLPVPPGLNTPPVQPPPPPPGPFPPPPGPAPPNQAEQHKAVPDIAQARNECAPTSTANSLIWLANQHGFRDSLPAAPRDLIAILKSCMKWNEGVSISNILTCKNELGSSLPISTKSQNAFTGTIPTFDFICAELKKGEDVEIVMNFDHGGAHMVTVVGCLTYPDGRRRLKIHDPDDDIDGTVYYWIDPRGQFIGLSDYPLANRVTLAVSESVKTKATQLKIVGPLPNQIPVGETGSITATVGYNVGAVGGTEVMFTKLGGDFDFTGGTISADGERARVTTDVNGRASMTFVPDGPGPALIKVTVTGSPLSAFSFFFGN